MKKIAVESLEAGDVFSEPVFLDEINVFAAAGVPLEQKEIDRIKTWNIKDVLTDGEIVKGPGKKSKVWSEETKSAPPPKPRISPVRRGVPRNIASIDHETASYAAIINIIMRVNAIFMLIKDRCFDIMRQGWQLDTISVGLIGVIQADSMSAVSFVLNGSFDGYPLARNAVQTAILSVLIFQELSANKIYSRDLLLGALLHDIGMFRLPESVTQKKGRLSDLERELMQTHVVYGYQIVRQELRCNQAIGNIVLQHHERWDGAGYSQFLGGNRIDIGAKIVAVADAFDAMVNEKPYRNSMTGYEAMKNLLSDNSHRFDPAVLSAFVKIMGIYPVGQEVLLNDGTTARVIDTRHGAPLRPLVVITKDKKGAAVNDGPRLDLLNQPSVFIVRAVQKPK
jgi:hypothetical protein